jgi:hypothetical protein
MSEQGIRSHAPALSLDQRRLARHADMTFDTSSQHEFSVFGAA